MKVYLGADHAGFDLKENLKKFLDKKKIKYEDLGAYKLNKNDDYPDFALKVAKKVSKEKGSRGILICGTGMGMDVAANKVKGIRAIPVWNEKLAKLSRSHNDANILSLSGGKILKKVPGVGLSPKKAEKIVSIWLKTPFEGGRHRRRIKKITSYEMKRR